MAFVQGAELIEKNDVERNRLSSAEHFAKQQLLDPCLDCKKANQNLTCL
jgi:hypothetical protein